MIITAAPRLAMDRSVRSIDADGRLHVSVTNISKANVCPYLGSEIPDFENMGLDPERVYQLLRAPDELEKAAATFNNLPILDRHVPVSAEEHMPEIVIGSTGTDAAFVDPYLQNSAVIWAQQAIDDVMSDQRRQWSCAYRYVADMTPGNFKGLPFDGIMRNIIGNHVALVVEGRAGADVMVGDQSMLKSRAALLLSGAMLGFLRPKLAADSKLDLTDTLKGVTAKNLDKGKAKLAANIVKIATPMLAADEGLEVGDVVEIIEAVQGSNPDDEKDEISDPAPVADEEGTVTCPKCGETFKPGVASDAEPPKPDDDKKDDKAMDSAAVKALIDKAKSDTAKEMAAIRQAERDVFPIIGEITVAQDSAAAVYKLALDHAKVDLTDVPESAYGAMVRLLPRPDDARPSSPRVAADASQASDFRKRFPTAGKLKRS